MAKKVTLLVGTKKGLFILRGDPERGSWPCEGPQFAPTPIHHASYDPRDGRELDMGWLAHRDQP